MTLFRRPLALALCAALALWIAPQFVAAQEPISGEELQKVLERLSRVEKELELLRKQKPGEVPQDPKDQRVLMLLESPYLGSIYYGAPQGDRFFFGKLLLINLTPQPLKLERKDVQLVVDGTAIPLQDVPQNLQYHGFPVNGQHVQLKTVNPPKEIQVAAGATASVWVFFPKLPQGNHVPKLELTITAGEKPQSLDVNAAQRRVLDLTVERVGPRESLALITIGGELNTISSGALVEELEQLQTQKVARAVITWTDSAAKLDSQLLSWLQNSAMMIGRGDAGQTAFPSIPATFREVHLARIPGQEGDPHQQWTGGGVVPRRLHLSVASAIRSALKSAYEALPREELLTSIKEGHPLTRAAALATGGGRLSTEQLPLILGYADDADPLMQEAALVALSHYGEETAVAKLVEYVKKNVEPLSTTAIASLASSRYSAAHDALLAILANEPPESKKAIISVLAQNPRPIWADAIYAAVRDPRSGLNLQALQALQLIGHPQVIEVLTEALNGNDPPLRNTAFSILVNRPDRESEKIAVEFTLARLAKEPPEELMLQLLMRVKDVRAVPLLLAQFDNSQNKLAVIQALAVIGDAQVGEQLAEKYAKLQSQEKAELLTALRKWKSPRFPELVKEALASNDSSLLNTAAQALVEDGSPAAVQQLIAALEPAAQPQAWSYICNALGMLATPEARAALQKARDTGPADRRNYAVDALRQIRQRSPAYQYIYQAQSYAQQKKWKETIEHYSTAIHLDPELPEAYLGRADAQVRKNAYAEAAKDYAKALELEPDNNQALTGVCITMAVAGEYAAAVEKLEAAREKNQENALFLYNAACVYGRALEKIQADDKIADRDMLIQKYQQQALKDLQQSVQRGFQDVGWMKKDPDLKPLHGLPEFDKITAKAPAPDAPAEEGAVPAEPEEDVFENDF